jgi:hypothetical protein
VALRSGLFECLEACGYFRGVIFGWLLALALGQRPQAVRRLGGMRATNLSVLRHRLADPIA